MIKWINLSLMLTVIVVAFLLFQLKHKVVGAEQEYRRLGKEIKEIQQQIKVLKAEWEFLTDVATLLQHAKNRILLRLPQASQFMSWQDVTRKLTGQ